MRRILYERQPFADNYVDDSFLKELRKNVNIRTYETCEAIVEVGVLTQEISSVVMFAVTFVFLEDGRLSPLVLLLVTFVSALALYVVHQQIHKDKDDDCNQINNDHLVSDVKLATVYLILNFAFSPVLKSLTETISSDTVYAMAVAAMIVHLITHDYGPSFPIVSAPLSFNAALFGVVCLASRLPDSMSTFALLTTSVEIFALVPHLRHRSRAGCERRRRRRLATVTVFCVCVTCAALSVLSWLMAFCFLMAIAFVNVVCPVWFVRMQKYKENLYGPWDEAILKPS